MAEAMYTTQNQNAQLTKTFLVAFAGMLLAVPIVAVLTAAIVKAQFGNLAHAQSQPVPTQVNTVAAGPSCTAPAGEQSEASASNQAASFVWGARFVPVNQSNTSTTTNTTNTTNTNVDSRFSGNSFSLTDNRFSGNTSNVIGSHNGNFSNNGNTSNSNNNIGNTVGSNNGNVVNSGNTSNSGNVVNSGNTVNSGNVVNSGNDNDGVDVL